MAMIPTKADFVLATDLKFVISGRRAEDRLLNDIDALLDLFHGLNSESDAGIKRAARINVLGRLYFATDGWLKMADLGSNSTINPRRRPAVFALYKIIVEKIKEETGVTENVMPSWLVQTFGKDMGDHGVGLDLRDGWAEYLSEQERRKYKLIFKGGLAYQQKWWENSEGLTLADTEIRNYNKDNVIANLFGGYAVSMSGDFYSGPHNPPGGIRGNARYHSSYLAGDAVLCAGEIRIKSGVVTHINNGSGHYQPDSSNLARAVESLAIQGINIRNILVREFGRGEMMAELYLARINESLEVHRTISNRSNAMPSARSRVEYAHMVNYRDRDERRDALETLKSHWINNGARKDRPGHGYHLRMQCDECRRHAAYWKEMDDLVKEAGGDVRNAKVSAKQALPLGMGGITRPRR